MVNPALLALLLQRKKERERPIIINVITGDKSTVITSDKDDKIKVSALGVEVEVPEKTREKVSKEIKEEQKEIKGVIKSKTQQKPKESSTK